MRDTSIVVGVVPEERTPRQVVRELRDLLASGARLLPAGEARDDPEQLLRPPHLPRSVVRLFAADYFLTGYRYDDDLNFLVAYVALHEGGRGGPVRRIHPRIFYKDSSLVWRVATHVVRTDGENWIGKGEVAVDQRADGEYLVSVEETTNLPFELQDAFDRVSRLDGHSRRDMDAVDLVLRHGPRDRIRPYADFTRPRERAARENPIHGNRPVARVTRRGDPSSVRFAKGYEPDFAKGVIEVARSASKLYGGEIEKFRILSVNRRVQHQFVAAQRHVWMNPPQALTTDLTSYGTRASDVAADELVFVPGYEYHFLDESEDPPALHTQIPEGFAGPPSKVDPSRADASAWIERMPVIRDFRRRVLRGRKA